VLYGDQLLLGRQIRFFYSFLSASGNSLLAVSLLAS
jgi:hypothetical protein